MRNLNLICLLILALSLGCNSDSNGDSGERQFIFGGDRPVYIEVPEAYDHSKATPLVVVLHGYGANAFVTLGFTQTMQLVEKHGALLVAPEGTIADNGFQFWNATKECCDFDVATVDDVTYLSNLIDEISEVWNVDSKRVYVFGHSNGGYMAFRLACELGDKIAAIASLAGAADVGDWCTPSESVSVLHIHGELDDRVLYEGRAECVEGRCPHPGAKQSVEKWAERDGCTGSLERADHWDLDDSLSGNDTVVENVGGCPAGVGVSLWTIEDGAHVPKFNKDFASKLWDWFQAHPDE